jgi:hypothetical protein
MLTGILSMFGGQIVEKIFGSVTDLAGKYINKQISEAQFKAELQQVMVGAFRDIEVAHADALAKTYASFMGAVEKSTLMQAVWAAAAISQIIVLVWHQMGIPALCYFVGNNACYPSSGATVNWAYLLLAGLMGMGPVVLRDGPGGPGAIADKLKSLVGK